MSYSPLTVRPLAIQALRNFELHGSIDGETWELLSEHLADDRLGVAYGSVGIWPVNQNFETGPFRYLRVTKTGRDSASNSYMHLSGLEVYGSLMLSHE